jgi:hypothetical protein
MRGGFSKSFGYGFHVDPVALLERLVAYPVLLGVVVTAEAQGPPIRRLDAHPSACSVPHMRNLDRKLFTAGDGAKV